MRTDIYGTTKLGIIDHAAHLAVCGGNGASPLPFGLPYNLFSALFMAHYGEAQMRRFGVS